MRGTSIASIRTATLSRGRTDRAASLSPLRGLGLFVLYAVAALFVYGPALDGEFISDDGHYVLENCWIQTWSAGNLREILDPTSDVSEVMENYAPVHLLLHGVGWRLFGAETRGHHVVNVLVHAAASLLLVLFFLRCGIAELPAMVGGALFLLHPANVEAVAWISQLKSSASLLLCLAALLAHPRRPAFAVALFACALLAKPTAAVALPVVVVLGLLRGASDEAGDWRWRWVAVWGLVFALFAVAEFAAFLQTAGQAPPLYPEWGVRLRTMFAVALRYLVLGAATWKLSAFHEPPPATSWLDPWWLASLAILVVLGWRLVLVARRRSTECAFWVWAAVSFAPVSGLIPLPFPMADRYLYFMLPGLLGALLLAGPEWLAWLGERAPARIRARLPLRPLLLGLAALLLIGFGLRAHERAYVFRSPYVFMFDAEKNYPEGGPAMTRRARRAALAGDVDGVVAALQAARARGYNRLEHLINDEAYLRLLGEPRVRAIVDEMAAELIERMRRDPEPSQVKLRVIAQALIVLGDRQAALAAMEQAAAVGGCFDSQVASELRQLRVMAGRR